ncbi:MAG: low specificity L-threonine aldolase [Bdellovibrionota bacterium]
MKPGFGSDNHSATHPLILESIIKAQIGHAPSYGTDEYSTEAVQIFREKFGPKTEVFFVFNGTSANVLSLKCLTKSYHSILCSDVSHLNVDECASPEVIGNCKLWALSTSDGKLKLDQLKNSLIRRGDQHFSQMKVVSITQPTEYGTVYSVDEIRQIVDWAHSEGLKVHVDGARLCNAAVRLNVSLKELITDSKIDAVSFGGTKNGFLFGEAVLVFDPDLREDLKYYRKQMGQLPSKTRMIAAQFTAYLKNNLWKEIASHSLQMARLLSENTATIPGVKITQKTESNVVFAIIPKNWVKQLRDEHFFYVWDEKTNECRWMTSWDTQPDDVMNFVKKLKELSGEISTRELS